MDDMLREFQAEKELIENTLDALNEALKRKTQTVVELAAIATFLQNAYSGIENILKRTMKYKGISVLFAESWHKDLLDMSVDNQIISLKLSRKLDEYRAFRHFFIHGYGVMLDKKKLIPLAKELPNLWKDFEAELNAFITSLKHK